MIYSIIRIRWKTEKRNEKFRRKTAEILSYPKEKTAKIAVFPQVFCYRKWLK